MSLRGVGLLNAATLVAELGDLHRFTRPAELMSYLGLVPSEHALQKRQEGLPKAVTDAAWEAQRRLHHFARGESSARVGPRLSALINRGKKRSCL